MDLTHDLLDKRVVDRNGRDMGRVDGIVLERDPGGVLRVAAIAIGPAVLAARIRPSFGRWVAALEQALQVHEGRPLRIPFEAILDIGAHIKVDRAVGETSAATVARRVRAWVSAIPGSS